MQAKVLSEKYQISYKVNGQEVIEDIDYKDAYWQAFLVAGTHRCKVIIMRVTTVETPEDYNAFASFLDKCGDTSEVVTGQVVIDAEHFARDINLGRYNPNNGWVLPEYVEDFEHCVTV